MDELAEWEGLCRSIAGEYFGPGLEREDLLQEARIGAFKGLRDFRPEHGLPLVAFLASCIRRQVITAVKTATRRKHEPLNHSVRVLVDPEGGDEDAASLIPEPRISDPLEVFLIREELADRIGDLDALTDLERVVVLAVGKGWSYEEIAEFERRGPKSIDNALQRAKRKLRELADERDGRQDLHLARPRVDRSRPLERRRPAQRPDPSPRRRRADRSSVPRPAPPERGEMSTEFIEALEAEITRVGDRLTELRREVEEAERYQLELIDLRDRRNGPDSGASSEEAKSEPVRSMKPPPSGRKRAKPKLATKPRASKTAAPRRAEVAAEVLTFLSARSAESFKSRELQDAVGSPPIEMFRRTLRELVSDGQVVAEGATKARRYRIALDGRDDALAVRPKPAPRSKPAESAALAKRQVENTRTGSVKSQRALGALREAGADGLTARQVGDSLGISGRAAAGVLERLKTKGQTVSSETDPPVHRLAEFGLVPADESGAKTELERSVIAAVRELGPCSADGPGGIHEWIRENRSNGSTPMVRSVRMVAEGLARRGVLQRDGGRFELAEVGLRRAA